MNKYTWQGWKRINKTKARNLWGKVDMILCPCKLALFTPFQNHITIFAKDIKENIDSNSWKFNNFVNNFEWYNCEYNETGYYASFYVKEK